MNGIIGADDPELAAEVEARYQQEAQMQTRGVRSAHAIGRFLGMVVVAVAWTAAILVTWAVAILVAHLLYRLAVVIWRVT